MGRSHQLPGASFCIRQQQAKVNNAYLSAGIWDPVLHVQQKMGFSPRF